MNLREWALPVYTILIQIASGGIIILWLIYSINNRIYGRAETERVIGTPLVVIFSTIAVAMIGAHFHLSKPIISFLSIMNIRNSWLSREVALTPVFAVLVWLLLYVHWFKSEHYRLKTVLGWIAGLVGLMTVYCMSRIYLMPTQVSWSMTGTIAAFLVSTMLLGVMALAALMIMDLIFAEVRGQEDSLVRPVMIQKTLVWLAGLALASVAVTLSLYFFQISSLSRGDEPVRTSMRLLMELYQPLFGMRLGLMLAGVGWFAYSVYRMLLRERKVQELLTPIYLSCLMVMIGEILGRFLFYATHIRLGI